MFRFIYFIFDGPSLYEASGQVDRITQDMSAAARSVTFAQQWRFGMAGPGKEEAVTA